MNKITLVIIALLLLSAYRLHAAYIAGEASHPVAQSPSFAHTEKQEDKVKLDVGQKNEGVFDNVSPY